MHLHFAYRLKMRFDDKVHEWRGMIRIYVRGCHDKIIITRLRIIL